MRVVDTDAWQARLEQAGLDEDLAEALAKLARPNVLLEVSTESGDTSIGKSKRGGLPDLPSGMTWPVRAPYGYPAERNFRGDATLVAQPLAFLLQVDLDDVENAGGTNLDLPKHGLLSVFYDAESQPWGFDPFDAPGLRVIWSEGKPVSPVDFPDQLATDYRFPQSALLLSASEAIPRTETYAVDRVLREAPNYVQGRYAIDDAFLAAEERAENYAPVDHALGGWPSPIQGAMEIECELVANGVYCGAPSAYHSAKAAEVEAGAANWRLLFQLGSDDDHGWQWGDAGNLYIWIREPDLAARRFDRCWAILQCT